VAKREFLMVLSLSGTFQETGGFPLRYMDFLYEGSEGVRMQKGTGRYRKSIQGPFASEEVMWGCALIPLS